MFSEVSATPIVCVMNGFDTSCSFYRISVLAFSAFERLLLQFRPGMHASGRAAQAAEQWLVDATAWVFNTIAHIVRDAWVTAPRRGHDAHNVNSMRSSEPGEIEMVTSLRDILRQQRVAY